VPCDLPDKGRCESGHGERERTAEGFAEDQKRKGGEQAPEFAEDALREMVEDEAADAGAGPYAGEGFKEIATDPANGCGQWVRALDEVEACDGGCGESGLQLGAEVAGAGADLDDAGSRCVGGEELADNPAGIAKEGIDVSEVSSAADGAWVRRIEGVQDFRSDDTLGFTHGLQWRNVRDSSKTSNMSSVIYLDNNATTQIAPEVFDVMTPWLRGGYGNPSSSYALGREAAAALDEARDRVAALAGCQSGEIVFTSCGTESINTAIQSALALDPDKRHIVTSAVEHSATVKLCEYLARRGYEITWLPVDGRGLLDLGRLEESIRPDTAVVSLLWANNETGVLFPVEEMAAVTQRKKTVLHIDAVQAFGKLPLALEGMGAQFVSFSGHKVYAAKGVGGLYVSRRVRFTPLLRGSQEDGRRGGTQNVASIVGFGKAAELAMDHLRNAGGGALRDQLEATLLAAIPMASVNGDPALRLPNTTNISFEGIESEGALILLDEKGLCCSAGSACTSGSVHPSHVLRAMGFSNERARSSLRFSVGRFTTIQDIDRACEVIPSVIAKLRELSPLGNVVLAA